MRGNSPTAESREWRQARQSALIQDVLAAFSRRPAALMSFEDVHQKLQLRNLHYLDVQEIPLAQIAGSVGRFTDFTRAFFPRNDHLREQWQRIEELFVRGRDLPPIEVYKVGQVYFVRDGNHRVSVARQYGRSGIKAHVWEYETLIHLEPGSDIDDLLCNAAHIAFVECTNIDRLCPGAQIRLTQPEGYEDLLREIEASQCIFSQIDRREITGDEAVTLWYEIRYLPIIEIIRQADVLHYFPGRTETDLYLWLCRNLQELEASYGSQILSQEAAHDLGKRFGKNPSLSRRAGRAASWWARSTGVWASNQWRAALRALSHKSDRTPGG
jgi:hypothetical protein